MWQSSKWWPLIIEPSLWHRKEKEKEAETQMSQKAENAYWYQTLFYGPLQQFCSYHGVVSPLLPKRMLLSKGEGLFEVDNHQTFWKRSYQESKGKEFQIRFYPQQWQLHFSCHLCINFYWCFPLRGFRLSVKLNTIHPNNYDINFVKL